MAKKSKSGFKTVKTKFRGNFEVPIGWDLSKLGDECKFEYGKALIEENRNNRGFFVYGSGGRIGKNSKFFTKGPGIIVARKGSLGNVFYEKQNFWPIDTVFYISKKETNHHLQFIFYILVYLKLENYKIVTAHPGISRDEVYTIFVKIPSFDEQKKIANILSNIDDVIDKYNSIIEITKKLQTSMMQQLFTKGIRHKKFKKSPIGEIPIEWSVKKLKKVTEKIERGKFSHRPRNDPKFYDGKYPFIQTGDVESSNGRITTFSQTLNELGLSVSKLFPKNTIVITIAANIGSTAITTFPVCFPDSLIGISAKNINLIFLEYFLRTKKAYLNNIATNSAQKNINLETLKPLLIPVPPTKEEQDNIAKILQTLDSKISELKSKKTNFDRIKKGLMQKLLTGQIRV